MAQLPYVTAPGNIDKALQGIKAAPTPENVSQDFVKTILQIPGGSGNQVTSFLRKIGFVNPDGSPSDTYKKFRNPHTSGSSIAAALKFGYEPLYKRNEHMHHLSDDKLKGLIIEETGQAQDSSPVALTLACIKALKKHADWTTPDESVAEKPKPPVVLPDPNREPPPAPKQPGTVGLNLSYTINLNLPATSDTAVFNAIFKSLREHLLRSSDEGE
jgi:hypothetical protein